MLTEKMDHCVMLVQKNLQAKKNRRKSQFKQRFSSLINKRIPSKLSVLESIHFLAGKEKFPTFNLQISHVLQKVEQILNDPNLERSKGKIDEIIGDLQKIEDEGKKLWQDYVRKENGGILKVIIMLQKIVPHDESLSRLIGYLQRLENLWPVTPEKWAQYEKRIEEAKQKLSEWDTTETIHVFLEKVSNNKATVDDLNAEVLEWLRKHQMTTNLMIKIK